MDMEHRRHWHIDIWVAQPLTFDIKCIGNGNDERMHDDLTMAKKYAFGIAGCTAGIEGCGNGVFIKIFKLVLIAGLC